MEDRAPVTEPARGTERGSSGPDRGRKANNVHQDLIDELKGCWEVPPEGQAVWDFTEACRRVDSDPRERQRILDIADLIDADDVIHEQAVAAAERGDLATAVPLLRRCATAGIGESAWLLAVALEQLGSTAEAADWYARAADDGDERARARFSSLIGPGYKLLTPADVRNKQFSTARMIPGYDDEEVDTFLDEVEVVLGGLIQENERLRTLPAHSEAGRQAGRIIEEARARAEALERDAQDRHRQALGSLIEARHNLESRVSDLRAFERDYHSRLKAYLEGRLRDLEAGGTDMSDDLDRRVGDLRAFEREYRSRLKAYLEGELRDLEAGVTDSGTPPVADGWKQLPLSARWVTQEKADPPVAPHRDRNGNGSRGLFDLAGYRRTRPDEK